MKTLFQKSKSVVILFGGTYIIAHFIVFVNVIVFHFKKFSLKKWGDNLTFEKMKDILSNLKKPQTALCREIERRYHETLSSQELKEIMKGKQSGNKAVRVKNEVEEVLNDWQKGG